MTRTFSAAFLPDPIRRQVSSFVETLRPDGPAIKWVSEPQLHFTLRFFGELGEDQVSQVKDVTREIVSTFPPLRIRIAGTGTFPARGRPRVYWLGLREGAPALGELAATLDQGYRYAGLGRADRPFSPHLTIGRAKEGRVRTGPPGRRVWEFGRLTFETPLFIVSRVCVVASVLAPQGPTYTPLAEFPLAGDR
jgi:2'-5' RNA ligase